MYTKAVLHPGAATAMVGGLLAAAAFAASWRANGAEDDQFNDQC